MNAPILLLCNELIYSHALRCALPSVAESRLRLPGGKLPKLVGERSDVDWIKVKWFPGAPGNIPQVAEQAALLPDPGVVFLDTDRIPAPDSLRGEQNQVEAQFVVRLLSALVGAGLDPREIGVISPYRWEAAGLP